MIDVHAPHEFTLLPSNERALRLFLLVMTQWRIAPSGQWIGLDYNALSIAARLAHLHISPQDFHKIQILERECLKQHNQKT